MSRLCNLGFSDETKRKLTAAYAENSGPVPTAKCQCGRLCVAKNYGGDWLPETHEKPAVRRAYKGGGYKRSSK